LRLRYRPTLLMVHGDRYRIEGSEPEFSALAAALATEVAGASPCYRAATNSRD